MSTTAAPQKLASLAHVCCCLQVMPDRVRAAAAELGVQPALTVDERVYFAADDVDRIRQHLAGPGGGRIVPMRRRKTAGDPPQELLR